MKTYFTYRNATIQNNLILQLSVNLLATLLSFFFWRRLSSPAILICQVAMLLESSLLLLFLYRRRKPLSFFQVCAVYSVNILLLLPPLWLANEAAMTLEHSWAPFQSHKFWSLLSALIAPPQIYVGALSVLSFGLIAALQYGSFSPEVRVNLVGDEPWVTLAFVLLALIVFLSRLKNMRLENIHARRRIEASVLSRLSHRLLAVKDLSNTPLQNLVLNSALLRARHPEEGPTLERVDRAILRLKDINRLAEAEDLSLPPHTNSFDGLKKLRRSLKKRA